VIADGLDEMLKSWTMIGMVRVATRVLVDFVVLLKKVYVPNMVTP